MTRLCFLYQKNSPPKQDTILSVCLVFIFQIGTQSEGYKKPKYTLQLSLARLKRLSAGNFLGVLVLAAAVAITVIHSQSENGSYKYDFAVDIFYSYQIGLNVVLIVVYIAAFTKTSKFPFKGVTRNLLHEISLTASVFAVFLLVGFREFPAIVEFNQTGHLGKIAKFETFSNVVTYAAATVQLLFLTDAMRRRGDAEHCSKHGTLGATLVSFSAFCNAALWVLVNISEGLEDTHGNDVSQVASTFYGKLAWGIVFYVCLPTAGYFRIISCVCLSDILECIYLI